MALSGAGRAMHYLLIREGWSELGNFSREEMEAEDEMRSGESPDAYGLASDLSARRHTRRVPSPPSPRETGNGGEREAKGARRRGGRRDRNRRRTPCPLTGHLPTTATHANRNERPLIASTVGHEVHTEAALEARVARLHSPTTVAQGEQLRTSNRTCTGM